MTPAFTASPIALPDALEPDSRHPIFKRFRPCTDRGNGSFWTDWLGVRVRRSFHSHYDGSNGVGYLRPDIQPPASEYFEWIALLCAVTAADVPFVMVDLGSGWGRWLLRAARACRQLDNDFRLVGVEPEPRHFDWMQTTFRDNDIDSDRHHLIQAAVGANSGEAPFVAGDSREWYGQSLLRTDQMNWALDRVAVSDQAPKGALEEAIEIRTVRILTLAELLGDLPGVHLLNMDIQNAEADVIEAAATAIDAQVELVHISTHSVAVEDRLRSVFSGLGWVKIFDFECQGQRQTPYGEMGFVDGVQTWVNPTAMHLLKLLTEPSLFQFHAVQNCFLQQRIHRERQAHALELQLLSTKLEAAIRQYKESERLSQAVRAQALQEKQELEVRLTQERERNLSLRRALARKFPRLARIIRRVTG
jgi:FkbM family methyltransferase